MDSVVCPFSLGGRRFYFWTEWTETSFKIQITDGGIVWEGEATEEYIQTNILCDVDIDVRQFISRSRDGLTVEDRNRDKFEYFLKSVKGNEVVKLEWRFPVAEGSHIKIKGEIELHRNKEAKPVLIALIDSLLSQQERDKKHRAELQVMNDNLRAQQKALASNLEKLRAEKELMYAEILSKFVELLNEKKKKIRELKEDLKKRPERAKEPEKSDDELEVTNETRPSPSLAIGSLSMAHSLAPLESLDMLSSQPERQPIKPSIRKRHRPETADSDISDLNNVISPQKRQKTSPSRHTSDKALSPVAGPRRSLVAKQIVDDEGSVPTHRPGSVAPRHLQGPFSSPQPSASYTGNAAPAPAARKRVMTPPKQPRRQRSDLSAGDLFDQIE